MKTKNQKSKKLQLNVKAIKKLTQAELEKATGAWRPPSTGYNCFTGKRGPFG